MKDESRGRADAPAGGAMARRARVLACAVVFLVSITASLVLLNLIAGRLNQRLDVTALGEHELSPRTERVLETLPGEFEVVLVGPWSDPATRPDLDPRIVQQVFDTFREVDLASERLRLVEIDTLSERGAGEFQLLLSRLVGRDEAELRSQNRELEAAWVRLGELIAEVGELEQTFGDIAALAGEAGELRTQLVAIGGMTRRLHDQLSAQHAEARQRLDTPLAGGDVPELDRALVALQAASTRLLRELDGFAPALRTIAEAPSTPGAVGDRLRTLSERIRGQRDAAARLRDGLAQVQTPDAIRVARALAGASAMLIVGPPGVGVTALPLDVPFRSPAAGAGAAQADVRRHAESVLVRSLASLTTPTTPIVVFAHGSGQANLLETGAIAQLQARLESLGMDVLEWAAVVQPDPPSTFELDPGRKRPVVFVAIPTDETVAIGDSPELAGPNRARALAAALTRVRDRGDAVLLTLNPSPSGSWGGDDPMAGVAEPFGLRPKTPLTLLRSAASAEGRVVQAALSAEPAAGGHALASAVGSLPIGVRWGVPIERAEEPASGLHAAPLLRIGGDSVWAESEWLGLWGARNEALAWRGPATPSPDASLDEVRGPWHIAWAAERASPSGSGRQRLVAIGASGWFFDAITQQSVSEGGRQVRTHAGNEQLFESAIYWLCGQDDLVAPGPTAREIARIRQISPGQRSAIAWGLIAGLPLGVLLLGLLWRLARG